MQYLNFKKDIYHVFLDNELILLDIVSDDFIFFDLKESLSIKKFIETNGNFNDNNKSIIFCKQFLEYTKTPPKLLIYNNIKGVDAHSWRDVKFYLKHPKHRLTIKNKILIIIICFFIFNFKSLNSRIKLFKFLKNKYKNSFNKIDNFANSSNIYIHSVLKFLPYQAKCLEHSFILGIYLILNGYNCNINFGVQKYNFLSHAWVDLNNVVIGDNPNLSSDIAKILTI